MSHTSPDSRMFFLIAGTPWQNSNLNLPPCQGKFEFLIVFLVAKRNQQPIALHHYQG
jgi:hypothetical protein